jgi:hypothetical protein
MSLEGIVSSSQELNGEISGKDKVRGRVASLKVYHTDAYRIAVAQGFDGTIDEWLESLKGKDYVITEEDKRDLVESVLNSGDVGWIKQKIEDLEYAPIEITHITEDVVKENGEHIFGVTIAWGLNKEPVSQTLNGIAVDVCDREKTDHWAIINEDCTYTLVVTDERGATAQREVKFSFYDPVYYGVVEDGVDINGITIRDLSSVLQNNRNVTFTANPGANQRIVYAVPVEYGTPIFKDVATGIAADIMLLHHSVTFQNRHGHIASYDVYQSVNVGLGNITIEVT